METEAPILWSIDAKSRLTGMSENAHWERLKATGEGDNRG